MIELMKSENWEQKPDESNLEFDRRITNQKAEYWNIRELEGRPILKIMIDRTVSLVYSKQINMEEIKMEQIDRKEVDKNGRWRCPFCYWTPTVFNGKYISVRSDGLMKILGPDYPEGFIDKGGVYAKCLCLDQRRKDANAMKRKELNTGKRRR